MTTPNRPAARGHRLWFVVMTALIVTAGLVVPSFRSEMERNLAAWLRAVTLLLGGFLLVVWFVFLSRLDVKARVLTAIALVILGVEARELVRVDGAADGRGLPKFAWKWKRAPAATLTSKVPILFPPAPVADAVEVTGFFGPKRDGIVTGARLATDWAAQRPTQLWRQPIGAGWSGFAVVGGRAFTQEQRGEDEAVSCYDVRTGQLVWLHTDAARFFQWQGGAGPRATPTVDRGRVFTYGATGILNCLDATTGRAVWTRNLLTEYKLENLTWGTSSSPLVYDDAVVVTGGLTAGPTVLAFHRDTGAPLWQAGTDQATYASPILATLAGRRVVLSNNAATLTAHDPATGAIVLTYAWSEAKWPKASQPVVLPGDRVFLSAGYGIGCVMLKVDAMTDSKLAGADGMLTATQLWKTNRMKTQFNSATLRGEHLYGLDDGLLACVTVADGQRVWKDGRFGSGQSLLVDDLLIIQSEPGDVVLAEAKPDGYRELARLPALSSKTWNHPTLAGRYLLLRNDREAVCYELPQRAE